jgi:capsular polysaccharide transport system ATP-binding protein
MIQLDRVFKYYRANGYIKVVLDHIDMDFRTGRNHAILGINGAGKSTLMRLLAGSELPNSGRVHRSVRVSWPLGFGTGLHPKLTGRENVRFVARLYGYDPKRATNFVEDFAEIGASIDMPISTYSSGMSARYSFGLSMAIDFECYLIDEITAVGDARFAARCRQEFDKRRQKADLIMISHDMTTIKNYCDRGSVLAGGKLYTFSNVDDAIELYKKMNQ